MNYFVNFFIQSNLYLYSTSNILWIGPLVSAAKIAIECSKTSYAKLIHGVSTTKKAYCF